MDRQNRYYCQNDDFSRHQISPQNGFILLNSQLRKPGLLELDTTPLPSNNTSMCAIAVESTILPDATSRWRTTPRIFIAWCSRLIVTSFVPSITISPFGRTSTTRAV